MPATSNYIVKVIAQTNWPACMPKGGHPEVTALLTHTFWPLERDPEALDHQPREEPHDHSREPHHGPCEPPEEANVTRSHA